MKDRHLCCSSLRFPWPRSGPQFFHSRIATDYNNRLKILNVSKTFVEILQIGR